MKALSDITGPGVATRISFQFNPAQVGELPDVVLFKPASDIGWEDINTIWLKAPSVNGGNNVLLHYVGMEGGARRWTNSGSIEVKHTSGQWHIYVSAVSQYATTNNPDHPWNGATWTTTGGSGSVDLRRALAYHDLQQGFFCPVYQTSQYYWNWYNAAGRIELYREGDNWVVGTQAAGPLWVSDDNPDDPAAVSGWTATASAPGNFPGLVSEVVNAVEVSGAGSEAADGVYGLHVGDSIDEQGWIFNKSGTEEYVWLIDKLMVEGAGGATYHSAEQLLIDSPGPRGLPWAADLVPLEGDSPAPTLSASSAPIEGAPFDPGAGMFALVPWDGGDTPLPNQYDILMSRTDGVGRPVGMLVAGQRAMALCRQRDGALLFIGDEADLDGDGNPLLAGAIVVREFDSSQWSGEPLPPSMQAGEWYDLITL